MGTQMNTDYMHVHIYLTSMVWTPLFLDLQSNLAITQRYPLWNQAVSELWYKREGCNTTEQIFTLFNFCHMMNIQTHTWKGHHLGSQRATEQKRGLP